MDGRAVFHRVVRGVAASIERTLVRADCTIDDVAWLAPHQANARIVDAIAARVGIDPGRVAANGDRYGNTSAASVPLLLAEHADAGRFPPTATWCCSPGSAPASASQRRSGVGRRRDRPDHHPFTGDAGFRGGNPPGSRSSPAGRAASAP